MPIRSPTLQAETTMPAALRLSSTSEANSLSKSAINMTRFFIRHVSLKRQSRNKNSWGCRLANYPSSLLELHSIIARITLRIGYLNSYFTQIWWRADLNLEVSVACGGGLAIGRAHRRPRLCGPSDYVDIPAQKNR